MTRILISGASIAGPALAYWLLKAGHDVTLVERAPGPRPGGQAIDIRGPALAVIAEMGLGARVAAQRTHLKGMTVLDRSGQEIERSVERTATGGPVPRLLESLDAAEDLYFGALAQVRMPSWHQGRIALLGDAAYCPSPFTGQGTSLALVGAFVLGRELARGDGDHAAAFARYEARMRPFVLVNQDLLSRDRQAPDADAVFTKAKTAIDLTDLLQEIGSA
jgi:2-polyprenyl-6-methoxyphenol hydroxylase-like FAD-dependent oxidoreductase